MKRGVEEYVAITATNAVNDTTISAISLVVENVAACGYVTVADVERMAQILKLDMCECGGHLCASGWCKVAFRERKLRSAPRN